MEVLITYHKQFLSDIKRLAKKYKSLKEDYARLLSELSENPDLGVDLGHGVRKVRMVISSKHKGKSGGARVITYRMAKLSPDVYRLLLLTMYDKNEIQNVSDSFIESLLDSLE